MKGPDRREEAAGLPDRRIVARRRGLCVETQGRDILAGMVHDEVDRAMRIGLYDEPGPLDGKDAAPGARTR